MCIRDRGKTICSRLVQYENTAPPIKSKGPKNVTFLQIPEIIFTFSGIVNETIFEDLKHHCSIFIIELGNDTALN